MSDKPLVRPIVPRPHFVSSTPFGLIISAREPGEAEAFEAAVRALSGNLSPADARPLGPTAEFTATASAQLRAMGGDQ